MWTLYSCYLTDIKEKLHTQMYFSRHHSTVYTFPAELVYCRHWNLRRSLAMVISPGQRCLRSSLGWLVECWFLLPVWEFSPHHPQTRWMDQPSCVVFRFLLDLLDFVHKVCVLFLFFIFMYLSCILKWTRLPQEGVAADSKDNSSMQSPISISDVDSSNIHLLQPGHVRDRLARLAALHSGSNIP